MNTDIHELLYENETRQIIGCAMEVLNNLGCGLLEKPYENAVATELKIRGVPFKQQERFNVVYKGVKVGEYASDLTAFGKVIVETKVVDKITGVEEAQLLNYLRIYGLKVGIILNFRYPKLQWKRLVL